MLAGSSWGVSTPTLRTSALALCYSVAEYCAPVWSRSAHTHLVDTRLHETMRIVSGTLHATPLSCLPVLSHIPPPNLRRQEATAKLLTKLQLNDKLPLCSDIMSHSSVRLLSRHPVWLNKPAPDATAAAYGWIDTWFNTTVVNQSLVTDPTICPPGFNLPRRLWSTLNRFRTGQGRCAADLVH